MLIRYRRISGIMCRIRRSSGLLVSRFFSFSTPALSPCYSLQSVFLHEVFVLTNISEGQVQPFWLDTSDGEKLFCYHVLPLDVYLEHESELVQAVTTGEVMEELESTVGAKLMKKDPESRVVVNFHGVSIFSFLIGSCFLNSSFPPFISRIYTCFDGLMMTREGLARDLVPEALFVFQFVIEAGKPFSLVDFPSSSCASSTSQSTFSPTLRYLN